MNQNETLRAALQELLDMYLAGANSGDWGNWDVESEPQVIAACAALAQPAASVVERGAGNVSDNAAPVAHAADALHIAEGYSARPYGDGYIIHHESGGARAADLAMVAAVREIERLRAAIAAPGVPPGWQPIETAPAYPFVKERWYVDGPRYLLSTGSSVFIGQYGYTERGKGRWQDHYGRICQPTHWMPLPAAPTAQQGASHEQP